MSRQAARVLITGASAGIGLALAKAWAERGAHLVLSARNPEGLATAVDAVHDHARQHGHTLRVEGVPGDVQEPESREALVARADELMGGLDVLVNNAGRGYYGKVDEVDVDELRALFELNVLAPLALTQRALPLLRASRGKVVMISSVAGVAAGPGMGAYAASKFALEALSTSLRAELAGDGVGVLVVRPGPVATAFREHASAVAGAARPVDGVAEDGRDTRQTAEDVACKVLRALDHGRDVLETSAYARGVGLVARAMPPVFRLATRWMAKRG